MSKYAPAREDGLKPYYVVLNEPWASELQERVCYARSAYGAEVIARRVCDSPWVKARRATPADMDRLRGNL